MAWSLLNTAFVRALCAALAAVYLLAATPATEAAQSKLDRFVSGLFDQVAPKAKKAKRSRVSKVSTQARLPTHALPHNPPLPTAAPGREKAAEIASAATVDTEQPAAKDEPPPPLGYAPVPTPSVLSPADDLAQQSTSAPAEPSEAKAEVAARSADDDALLPEAETPDAVLLASIPVPQPRPDFSPAKVEDDKAGDDGAPGYQDPAGATRATSPAEELACRSRLKKLGVDFKELAFISDPNGCAVTNPISVASLGQGIELSPSATMNCAMAEAAAGFAQNTIAPSAQSSFGSPLAGIDHASAYICRPRHGTQKLSEHAFGNALDIQAFRLKDKRRIEVHDTKVEDEASFLASIRSAACGPFKTVLGPGVADHDTHFHFDLEPRRRGGSYCR